MREIIERGYLYIAQPPLFKITNKKQELYIHNEQTMLDYVLENGVSKIRLLVEEGGAQQVITGKRLTDNIRKAIRIDTILKRFEKDGYDRELIATLAADGFLIEKTFTDRELLEKIAARVSGAMGKKMKNFALQFDQELGTWKIEFSLWSNNKSIKNIVSVDTLKLPKFTEIKSLFMQIESLGKAPYKLSSLGEAENGEETNIEIAETLTGLVEHIVKAGKKGIAVQRYKGLGEMNPEQLWETTMNPEKRTLLQVLIEDAVAADETFTTLMGDQVEPRREFIFKNAMYASNLDV